MKIPGIIPLVFGLIALSVIFALLERLGAALPRKTLLRRERVIDFAYWFFTPWVSKTAAAIAVFLSIVLIALGSQSASSPWFAQQTLGVQLLELLVIGDLLGYLSHRLFHSRFLWKFHAIHHSAEDVDWLAATRLHPVNERHLPLSLTRRGHPS